MECDRKTGEIKETREMKNKIFLSEEVPGEDKKNERRDVMDFIRRTWNRTSRFLRDSLFSCFPCLRKGKVRKSGCVIATAEFSFDDFCAFREEFFSVAEAESTGSQEAREEFCSEAEYSDFGKFCSETVESDGPSDCGGKWYSSIDKITSF